MLRRQRREELATPEGKGLCPQKSMKAQTNPLEKTMEWNKWAVIEI